MKSFLEKIRTVKWPWKKTKLEVLPQPPKSLVEPLGDCDHRGFLVPEFYRIRHVKVSQLVAKPGDVHQICGIVTVWCLNCGSRFENRNGNMIRVPFGVGRPHEVTDN